MSLTTVLLAVLVVLAIATVKVAITTVKSSKVAARQMGNRTEEFIRNRIAAHGRFYRLKKKLARMVFSVVVVTVLCVSSMFSDINIDIDLIAKEEVVSDAVSSNDKSYIEGPYIEGVSIDGPVVEVSEEEIEASNEERHTIDAWVKDWIETYNCNETALTYATDMLHTGIEDNMVKQELVNNWTRESYIGFDYTIVIEHKTIDCEFIYINYVIPTNNWLELDMEDMDKPFVHYYESSKYDYVKNDYCTVLNNIHNNSGAYKELVHIISDRKEVR